jgi:hypothetical protein
MPRKPRSDSKLDNLPEPQFMQLRDGLLKREFKSYEAALSWLAVECGVSSTASALSSFYKRHCAPLVAERRQFAAIRAEALGEAMEDDPVNWDQAIIERTKQLTFEFLDSDEVDADSVKKLLDAILKAQRQQMDREKLTHSTKSKIEAGLDALFEEIKGNEKAEAIFAQLKEVTKE